MNSAVHHRTWDRQYLSLGGTSAVVCLHINRFIRVGCCTPPGRCHHPWHLPRPERVSCAGFLREAPKLCSASSTVIGANMPRHRGYISCKRMLPTVRVLTEVARLLEAASDPQWWPRQVAKAEAWIANPVPCIKERTAQPRDFRCEECGSSFLLRKHLHLQMAKSHRIFSPARHFTLSPACMMVWQHQAKPATPQTVAAVPGYGRPSHSSPGLQSDP